MEMMIGLSLFYFDHSFYHYKGYKEPLLLKYNKNNLKIMLHVIKYILFLFIFLPILQISPESTLFLQFSMHTSLFSASRIGNTHVLYTFFNSYASRIEKNVEPTKMTILITKSLFPNDQQDNFTLYNDIYFIFSSLF